MAWTNGNVLEFLDLYRKEPILWDPKNPSYRSRTEIAEAWDRIQNTFSLKCAVVDLKRKKESLMASFRMHLNRKKKRLGNYQTSWFAFSHMESFLGGNYECDSTSQMEQELNNRTYTQSQQMLTEINVGVRANESNTASRYSVTPNADNKPKKKNNPNVVFVRNDYKEETQGLEKAEIGDFDEYDLYGQLLAKKLRKLEEHQRDVAMHEIDNIMFRAKMQGGTSQTQSFDSSPSPVHRKIKSPIFIVTQNTHEYEDENIHYQEHMQPQSP